MNGGLVCIILLVNFHWMLSCSDKYYCWQYIAIVRVLQKRWPYCGAYVISAQKRSKQKSRSIKKSLPLAYKSIQVSFLGSTFGESEKILQWGKGPTYLPQPPPKLPFMQLMRKMIMGFSDKITLSRVIFLSRISVIINNSFACCRKKPEMFIQGS